MTANPNWAKIPKTICYLMNQMMMILIRGRNIQTTSDRPDIVGLCVWLQKIKAMLKTSRMVFFGDIQGYVFTIEFQKKRWIWVLTSICSSS